MAAVDDAMQRLFEEIRTFSWHETKRRENLRKHGIDFEDARRVFADYVHIRRSDRYGEIRYQIFGVVDAKEIALACTVNGTDCRVISARRARKDERRRYYGRPQE